MRRLAVVVVFALALTIAYLQGQGLIAGVSDFVLAYHTFHKVTARIDVLLRLTGPGRGFGGPIPAVLELRNNDVWIITPPKSGTTWVSHMAHQVPPPVAVLSHGASAHRRAAPGALSAAGLNLMKSRLTA